MKYVREIESVWLVFYFGIYLSILMSAYLLFGLLFEYFPFLPFWTVLLAFFSFLLVCVIHEIGHCIALRLKNYVILSIQVWLYLLPQGVNHHKWRSCEDVPIVCLSGPIVGVVGSLVLGYILFLFAPTTLLLAILIGLSAVALGYRDYKELRTVH